MLLTEARFKRPAHRHQHRQPRGAAQKLVHHDAEHLREIAHGGFAGVGLPVGVAGEAPGLHERQVPRTVRQLLRVQRQPLLGHEDRHDRTRTRPWRTAAPPRSSVSHVISSSGSMPVSAIDQVLHGQEKGMEKGFLAFEHLGHEAAHRRRQRDADAEEQNDLNDFNQFHVLPSVRFMFCCTALVAINAVNLAAPDGER